MSEEVDELNRDHEQGTERKNGRCIKERAEEDEPKKVEDEPR